MKVLKPIGTSQTLTFVPRNYVTDVTVNLLDESTDTSNNYNLSATQSNDYLSVSGAFTDLVEGRFYVLTVSDLSSNVIYKDRIFCTAQTISQVNNDYYDINSGEYTEEVSNNEYIILE